MMVIPSLAHRVIIHALKYQCYGLNVYVPPRLPNLYVEALTLNVMMFGLTEVISFR